MPPKRKIKRKHGNSEAKDINPEVSGVTTQREEGGQGDIPTGSGPSEGRLTDPLTKGDIPGIIQEITKQLHSESNRRSHTSLTPSTLYL